MQQEPECLERIEFDAARLMGEFPPRWRHANKQVVYGISCPEGFVPAGQVGFSRWRSLLPQSPLDAQAAIGRTHVREAIYDYESLAAVSGATEWHVNFADPELFVAYGSALFAQDEMQVAEHPVLGSVREALVTQRRPAATVDERGAATPVLVTGAERRCRVATDHNPAQGRPAGLYGNAFASATPAAIARATAPIDPPTRSHLIAMSALPGGEGKYSLDEIAYTLATAFSGFRAAVLESARACGPGQVVVHTGFWGCGAFGGNRVLMSALQMLAAQAAGVTALAFHTVSPEGTRQWNRARDVLAGLEGRLPSAMDVCSELAALGFEWGESDGN